MATEEYIDMFLKCQDTGMYHMYTFDLKDSKAMETDTLFDAETKLFQLVLRVYKQLQAIEKETGNKILLDKSELENEVWMNNEPFFLGDASEITVYRDSISSEDFWNLFETIKRELNFDYELHTGDGYYETTHLVEGHDKYARSYCFQLLTDLHKPKYATLRKKIGKIEES